MLNGPKTKKKSPGKRDRQRREEAEIGESPGQYDVTGEEAAGRGSADHCSGSPIAWSAQTWLADLGYYREPRTMIQVSGLNEARVLRNVPLARLSTCNMKARHFQRVCWYDGLLGMSTASTDHLTMDGTR